MKKAKDKSVLLFILYVLTFIFILGVALCCPMINDDYSFISYGLKSFDDIFKFSLYYGNGRLLGNLTSLLLIANPTAFAVQKAIILLATIAFLPKATTFGSRSKGNGTLIFLGSFLLVLGMSPLIFQEVFTWSTGFQNYVPPVLGLIISVCLIKSESKNPFVCILLFVVSLASQLFLELNTLVNVIFAFVVLLVVFLKKREKLLKAAVNFISSVIGAAIMIAIPRLFVDPIRQQAISDYRGFHLDSIKETVLTAIYNIVTLTVSVKTCVILLVILAAVMFIVVSISGKGRLYKGVCRICLFSLPIFCVFNAAYLERTSFHGKNLFILIFLILIVLFTVGVLLSIISMEKCAERTASFIALLFVPISFFPVTIVTPVAPRCSFLYYMFLSAVALISVGYLSGKKKLPNSFGVVAAICSLLLVFFVGLNFYNLKIEAAEQTESIKSQLAQHAEVITLKPSENVYMHDTAKRMFGYYYYYNQPFDVEFQYK